MASKLRTVIPIWGFAVVVAVAIGVFVPTDEAIRWMPIAMAVAVLLTFVVQIVFVQQHGLVDRVMLSIGGAILILAVATGILRIVGSAGG